MSPAAGLVLVDEIMPIIEATVPRAVKQVGAEDCEELVQDTVTMAAQFVESCEARGKPIYPSSVAYYAIQHAKSGRRSYGATRTDALCPAAQLDGRSTVTSMDEPIPCDDDDELSLHDLLAAPEEDPAQQAGREMDWAELMESLSDREVAILKTTISGDKLDALASRFGISPPRITQLKRELGRQIKLRWGDGALADAIRPPRWNWSIRAGQERSACRHERASKAK